MWQYLIRRILYAIPILLMVNLLTFSLFFMINSPDDIARMQLGGKHTTPAAITHWKATHHYNLPLFYNAQAHQTAQITDTLFFQKTMHLFTFKFGQSLSERDIVEDIRQRMGPSLAIAVPTLIFGIFTNILLALILLSFRGTRTGHITAHMCITLMSISTLFYIIGGQYWLSKMAQLVPISGWQSGLNSFKFILLPVFVSIISGLGAGSRWYRAVFEEEWEKDYIRTAKAKGLSEWQLLFKHVVPNGLIPIVTGIVALLPLLFMGSLLVESFFGIPGLGSYTLDAIQMQDFEIVRVIVFIGTLLYLIGLMLTDVVYTWIDPRIRLH